MEKEGNLKARIRELKKEKGYIILAHNYQEKEVQEIADFTGDSLELARKALKLETPKILFLGVDFMAETAKILNPKKKVIVARSDATCPMANSLEEKKLQEIREKHPGIPVVLYVNSTARAKTYADYTCTSANAVNIVSKINSDTVFFGPDKNLASYVAKKTGKKVIPIPGDDGFCYVHNEFSVEDIQRARKKYPEALIMVHPECPEEVCNLADYIGSTGGMAKFPATTNIREFVVGTEIGMIYKLETLYPDKTFYPLRSDAICHNMKKTKLEYVLKALEEEREEIILEGEIIEKAKKPIENMFHLMES